MRERLLELLSLDDAWMQISPGERGRVADLADCTAASPRTVLCRAGDTATSVFCVVEGALELLGDDEEIIAVSMPGSTVALTAALQQQRIDCTIRAAERGAVIARFDAAALRSLVDSSPQMAAALYDLQESAHVAQDLPPLPPTRLNITADAPVTTGPQPRPPTVWQLFVWPTQLATDVAVASIALAWCTLASSLLAKYIIDEAWLRGVHHWLGHVVAATVGAALLLFLLDCLRQDLLLYHASMHLRAVLDDIFARLTRVVTSPVVINRVHHHGPSPVLLGEAWSLALTALGAAAAAILLLYLGHFVGVAVLACVALSIWAEDVEAAPRGVLSRVAHTAAHATALAGGGLAVIFGALSTGGWVACLIATQGVTQAIDALFVGWTSIEKATEDVHGITEWDSGLQRAEHVDEVPERAVDISGSPRLAFVNVTFAYPAASKPALTDIDLIVPGGSWLGIVAPSGAGATTLLRLAVGAAAPMAGHVALDDVVVDRALVDHAMCLWSQPALLQRTLYDNIALVEPDCDRAAVHEAAALAGLAEFVTALPRGWETPLDHMGGPLSRGQQQCVALARLFLARPRLILIDHATYALANDRDRAWQTQLRRVLPQSTVVFATRRLHTLRACDAVALLWNGRVVAHAEHAALWREDARYRALAQVD